MMAACDAAILLGGRPLRARRGDELFTTPFLTKRTVKTIDLPSAVGYNKTERKVKYKENAK
jgi:hypothetical protein